MKKTAMMLAIATAGAIVLYSCEERGENDPSWSTHNDAESHYNGRNCMDCHYDGGTGEGWFTMAGTTSGNFREGEVEIWTEEGGSKITSVEIDALGNFYTTREVDYTGGVSVAMHNGNGQLDWMEGKIFHGQCNLCHGTTTGALDLE